MSDSKILIAYFSRADMNYVNGSIVDLKIGNTEIIANTLQTLTHGDLFKIEAITEYPKDYDECTDVSKQELRENTRPTLKNKAPNFESYDTIILAYPNWWGTMPMPVWTFLEQAHTQGKTILPICTHEGSRMGNSERDLRKLCPSAILKPGLAIVGSRVRQVEPELRTWLVKSGVLAV